MVKFKAGEMHKSSAIGNLCEKYSSFREWLASTILQHMLGDWRELPKEDVTLNNEALKKQKGFVFSSRIIPDEIIQEIALEELLDTYVVIITNIDSLTAILFACEFREESQPLQKP